MNVTSETLPVQFLCRGCKGISSASLTFVWRTQRLYRGQWLLDEEHETTEGMATCEHCQLEQQIWPKASTDQKWTRR